MSTPNIVDSFDEAHGQRCRSFWEHLIARHPLEARYSKPTKRAYRWREIPELRLVVAQYISFAQNRVGVFIRGELGVSSSAVRSRLQPLQGHCRRRCELSLFLTQNISSTRARIFESKTRKSGAKRQIGCTKPLTRIKMPSGE